MVPSARGAYLRGGEDGTFENGFERKRRRCELARRRPRMLVRPASNPNGILPTAAPRRFMRSSGTTGGAHRQ